MVKLETPFFLVKSSSYLHERNVCNCRISQCIPWYSTSNIDHGELGNRQTTILRQLLTDWSIGKGIRRIVETASSFWIILGCHKRLPLWFRALLNCDSSNDQSLWITVKVLEQFSYSQLALADGIIEDQSCTKNVSCTENLGTNFEAWDWRITLPPGQHKHHPHPSILHSFIPYAFYAPRLYFPVSLLLVFPPPLFAVVVSVISH